MSSSQAPKTWKDVFINVDLHAPASLYLDKLDSWKELSRSAARGQKLNRLVYRYEQLWLPLLASSNPSDELEPPNDVHWIWHLHQLLPDNYSSYCNQRFKRVLPHRLRSLRPSQRATAIQKTAGAWRERYPGELFDLSPGDEWVAAAAGHGTHRLADQLMEIARREVDFAYQVSLPHVRDANFLYAGVERYRKLLLLWRLRAVDITNIPLPVDILLILRVHALHPTQHIGDIRRLFGESMATLSIDWASLVYDAPSPSIVNQYNGIWERQFGPGETLFVDGSGLRGLQAGATSCGGEDTAIRQLSRELVSRSGIESCDVTFTSLTVDDEVWSRSGIKRVSVEARLLGQSSFAREILFRTSGSIGAPISGGNSNASLGSAHFSVSQNRGIELAVFGRQGVLCFARKRNLTTKTFNPVQHCSVDCASTTITLPKVTYTDPKITVTFNVQAAAPKPLVFTLDRNNSSMRPIPTSLRRYVGAMRTWATVIGSPDSLFQHSRHGLKCRDSQLAFGVEVVKHEHSDLGAVLLHLNNEQIVAAAYYIDNDQLPQSKQVSEVCPVSLDGNHAMLVRNHDGDYAICTATWLHYSTVRGDLGCSRIQYRVYFISTRQVCTFEVSEDEMHTIKMPAVDGTIEIDLPTGRLTVDANVKPLAEYLTLAFAIGVLFVTMQKPPYTLTAEGAQPIGSIRSARSSAPASGRTSPTPSDASSRRSAAARLVAKHARSQGAWKKMSRRRKMSASFTFLLACGLQVDYALYGTNSVNGGDSIGRGSITAGHYGNTNAPAANGDADYRTSTLSGTARRPQLHQQAQQQTPSPKNEGHYIDVRL